MSIDMEKNTRMRVGEKAPNFSLESSEGEMVSLSDFDGQWKVVFFYALNGSPTCKRGCLNFKEQYSLFRSVDCEIIGISQDPKNDHKEFKEENDLPFPILGDPDRSTAKEFGVPMHLGQFPSKSSFVIAPDRTVRHVYDWLFRPRNHVAKILAALSDVTEGGRFE